MANVTGRMKALALMTLDYPWAPFARAALKRFVAKLVAVPGPAGLGDCWEFQGGKSRGGQKSKGQRQYGSFWVFGKWTVRAHIFVCVVEGRMEKGNHVDHLCNNTICCRSSHLEPVPPLVNEMRKIERRAA